MKQRIQNPKTRNELLGMSDETLIEHLYETRLLLLQDLNCLSRTDFINTIYNAQFDQIPLEFEEIISNPKYYEKEEDKRFYLYCPNCGYVQQDQIDHNSEYLDLHCKCGSHMYYDEYTLEHIDRIIQRNSESREYGEYFMKDIYEEMKKDSIVCYIKRFRKIWYYGY